MRIDTTAKTAGMFVYDIRSDSLYTVREKRAVTVRGRGTLLVPRRLARVRGEGNFREEVVSRLGVVHGQSLSRCLYRVRFHDRYFCYEQ